MPSWPEVVEFLFMEMQAVVKHVSPWHFRPSHLHIFKPVRTVGGMSRSAALVVAHLASYKGMYLSVRFDERVASR